MNEVFARILYEAKNAVVRFLEWLLRAVLLLYKIPRFLILHLYAWFMGLRFWPKMGFIGALVGLGVFIFFYSTLEWAAVVESWFRSSEGTEVLIIVALAALGLIYWKFPHLFSSVIVIAFIALFVIFVFELNRSPLEREGQDHWAMFFIYVLPLLPVLFTMFMYKNKVAHAVTASVYLALIVTLLATNPNTIFQPRIFNQGTVYIVTILVFVALLTIVFNQDVLSQDWSDYLNRVGMAVVCCTALAFGVTMAINFFTTNPTWSIRYLIMLLILIVAGAIVVSSAWKRLPNRSYFAYFSSANLAVKTLLLLSCWTSDLMASIVKEPLQTWGLLLLEIVLIVWYFISSQVFTKMRENGAGGVFSPTGTMLRNEPLGLRYETVIPISKNFRYNYAISCWVYLNPQPPNASPEATGFSNIVSYGGRPAVSFNAATNTLRITMRHPGGKKKQGIEKAVRKLAEFSGDSLPAEPLDFSGPHDVLIADIPDVTLQKWVHLVFFYSNAGMLDIFINGTLYKSVAAMVSNESSGLTVGAAKGNTGRIANVMFFQSVKDPKDAVFVGGDAIDASTVHTLYNDFKSRDPPVVSQMFPVWQQVFREAESGATSATTNVSQSVSGAAATTQGSVQGAIDPNRQLERSL
jgi:hypothetical protein